MTRQPRYHPLILLLPMFILGIVTADALCGGWAADYALASWLCDMRNVVLVLSSLVIALALSCILSRGSERSKVVVVVMIGLSAFVYGHFLLLVTRFNGYRGTLPLPDMAPLLDVMAQVRESLLNTYHELGMDEEEEAVVAAMTLGEKGGMTHELRESYNISGAGHIFALSGLHLNIIAGILYFVLRRLMSRKCQVVVLLACVWAFVVLVGCNTSVVRAAVMLSVYAPLQLLSERPGSVNVLFLTAFVLLIVNPAWLFGVGFQMSFLAVYGIVMLMPLIGRPSFLRHEPDRYTPLLTDDDGVHSEHRSLSMRLHDVFWSSLRWLWSLTALSFSAQLCVAPLIVHYFGRFSTYFFLSNLIVSPLAFAIILLAVVVLVLSVMNGLTVFRMWLPTVTTPILMVAAWLLARCVGMLNMSIGWLSSLPYSHFDGLTLSGSQTIVIYMALLPSLYVLHSMKRDD